MRAAARATKWSSLATPAAAFSAASATLEASGVPATAWASCVRPGGLGGLRTEQARDEGLVEGIDGRQGFVEPGDGFREQVGAHHATTLVGGNHCISGRGAVVGVSSR